MPTIRKASLDDSPRIADIYNWYIESTTITFEEEMVSAGDMAQRIAVTDHTRPWFVLEDDGLILGYAYAARWKGRFAYRLARETAIYLALDNFGEGLCKHLYEHLTSALKATEVHTLIAGIALPNEASIALHEKLDFVKVGEFEKVGIKFDNYSNVGCWHLVI